jgi:hypothetical protein
MKRALMPEAAVHEDSDLRPLFVKEAAEGLDSL